MNFKQFNEFLNEAKIPSDVKSDIDLIRQIAKRWKFKEQKLTSDDIFGGVAATFEYDPRNTISIVKDSTDKGYEVFFSSYPPKSEGEEGFESVEFFTDDKNWNKIFPQYIK